MRTQCTTALRSTVRFWRLWKLAKARCTAHVALMASRGFVDVLGLIFQAAKLGVKFFDELFSGQFLTASAIDFSEPQQHVGNCPLVARTKLGSICTLGCRALGNTTPRSAQFPVPLTRSVRIHFLCFCNDGLRYLCQHGYADPIVARRSMDLVRRLGAAFEKAMQELRCGVCLKRWPFFW